MPNLSETAPLTIMDKSILIIWMETFGACVFCTTKRYFIMLSYKILDHQLK